MRYKISQFARLHGVCKRTVWNWIYSGTHHDRDGNAAANILAEGVRLYKDIVGLSSPEVTGGDCPTVDDRRALRDLRSSGEDEPSNECHFTVFQ